MDIGVLPCLTGSNVDPDLAHSFRLQSIPGRGADVSAQHLIFAPRGPEFTEEEVPSVIEPRLSGMRYQISSISADDTVKIDSSSDRRDRQRGGR
jgi:hypothetical protein